MRRNISISKMLFKYFLKQKIFLFFFVISLFTIYLSYTAKAQSLNNFNYHKNSNIYSPNQNSSIDTQDVLTKLGQWGWGPCSDAAVQGKYVYIGNGYLFQVLDVSNPASPKIVGQLSMEYPVYRVRVEGNYAYVTYPFNIIDISNPANPVLVTTYNIRTAAAGPTAEAINGNYAYLGDGLGFVYIIDISDPSNPREIGRMRTAGEIVVYIAVKDTVLYASTNDNYVNIFNIANPEAPFWIPSQIPYVSVPLAIDGHYIYTGSGTLDGEFQMYDIIDPYNPRLVNGISLNIDSEYTSGIIFTSVSVVDTIAYLTGVVDTVPYYPYFNEILFAVDIADTNNIHIISKLTNPYNASDYYGWGFGGGGISFPFAYYATNTGLWTVNLQRSDSMKSVSYFPTGWYINKITVDSSYHAYLAESFGGLKILDFSTPSSPKMIGNYYSPGEQVIDAIVSDSYAYLDCNSGLQILDVSNPAYPTLISKISFNDSITTKLDGDYDFLCIDGSTVYAARKSQKLFTVDVSDPSNPKIESTYTLSDVSVGIYAFNGYIYIGVFDKGIQVLEINNLGKLIDSSFVQINSLRGLTGYKNSLYILGYDTTSKKNALKKYDITDSSRPILRYILDNDLRGISTADIKANEDYAYIASGNDLLVVDISNPNLGKNVYSGSADTLNVSGFISVALYNNLVLTGYFSVDIFKNNLITGITTSTTITNNFELFQNYPNPFNPSTTIKYQIPKAEHVTIKIYDILGRLISTMVNETQRPGNYEVQFNATNLASGIYFYRLTYGDLSQVKKMIVIK